MSQGQQRLLAAIMFADIAGYTAMMQDDENKAIVVRKRHIQILDQEHQNFLGKIVQYYCDGTLSIFKSADEALKCAIEFQTQFSKYLIVPLRIGIHLGDIVMDGDFIYGDGVNLASRIESAAVKEVPQQNLVFPKILKTFT